jgi:NAD(P)-dependent dehydrogenase (short-subunit alcohol dehydrogenase family)
MRMQERQTTSDGGRPLALVTGASSGIGLELARQGFEAMVAGKDHVIAGSRRNKAQVAGGRLLPEPARAAWRAAQTRPGEDDA